MKLGKFFHSNKGFFILSLVAAVVGLVISMFFGGCTRDEEPNRVIVSKRVKIEVQEPATSPAELTKKELKAGEGKPLIGKEAKKSITASKALKKTSVQKKRKRVTVMPLRQAEKRAPLKTLQKSWVVNVASFTKAYEAQRLEKRLSASGRNVYITQFTKGGILYYRVRVGFYESRVRARREGIAIATLFRDVGSPWVVKPGMDEILSHSK